MKNSSQVAIAAFQIITAAGSVVRVGPQQALSPTSGADQQRVANQLSLSSIEQSWLAIPRICKAAGFNAQPTASRVLARTSAVNSIYNIFAG